MLKMRLQRVGRKHEPSFRLVLTDSTNSTKSGRFKEILGAYDPRKSVDFLKTDRIKELLSKGISPTDTVHNLLIKHNIIDAKKKNVLPKKTYTPPAVEETPAQAPEAPAVEETPVSEIASEPVSESVEPVETSTEHEAPVVDETPTEAPAEDAGTAESDNKTE